MWLFSVPLFLILIIVLFLGAGIFEAMQINIMPIVSIIFLIIGVVNLVLCFKKENKIIPIIFAAISIIIFVCTLGISMSTGDILSWIWYHI